MELEGLEVCLLVDNESNGHVGIVIITEDDRAEPIVWGFGRYDGNSILDLPGTGLGILYKHTSQKAISYIKGKIENGKTKVYEVTDADKILVNEYF